MRRTRLSQKVITQVVNDAFSPDATRELEVGLNMLISTARSFIECHAVYPKSDGLPISGVCDLWIRFVLVHFVQRLIANGHGIADGVRSYLSSSDNPRFRDVVREAIRIQSIEIVLAQHLGAPVTYDPLGDCFKAAFRFGTDCLPLFLSPGFSRQYLPDDPFCMFGIDLTPESLPD